MAASLGVALLAFGTFLHPMSADPNDARAAFAEYAADPLWIASHLTQLFGLVLMIAGLLVAARVLASGPGALWARVASAGASAGIAVGAAVQAVDGVALKKMVDAWAVAPEGAKPELFYAAFAVRQIEVGLASMLCLLLGATVCVFGLALRRDARFGTGLALLAFAGGVPTFLAGIVMAYTGFSETTMLLNMPANMLLLVWVLLLSLRLHRLDDQAGAGARSASGANAAA